MPRTTKHLKKHQFKAGAPSANPDGGRKHNPITKALGRLTVDTYREVIELVLTSNLAEIKRIAEHPDTPGIKVGVCIAFLKAIKSGDYGVIERIAERIVGKIPDVITVNSNAKHTLVDRIESIDRDALKIAMRELDDEV